MIRYPDQVRVQNCKCLDLSYLTVHKKERVNPVNEFHFLWYHVMIWEKKNANSYFIFTSSHRGVHVIISVSHETYANKTDTVFIWFFLFLKQYGGSQKLLKF